MGITIHYNGKIKDSALIEELREEVADICRDMNWEYHLIEPTIREEGRYVPITGIVFTPGSDSVPLLFDDEGRMRSLLALVHYDDKDEDQRRCFVKTQWDSTELHITLVKLFKYLFPKYLAPFQVIDEGEYWTSGDRKRLEELFTIVARGGQIIAHTLENHPALGEVDEDPAAFGRRIEDVLRKQLDAAEGAPPGDEE